MQNFQSHHATFFYVATDKKLRPKQGDKPLFIWAHGWGQSHDSFTPLMTSLEKTGHHIALDFPGFGQSPPPSEKWGTEDYANALIAWMKEQNLPPVIWVGHSFGCRVGIQIAARAPECLAGLALISGAGLRRKRPLYKRIYFQGRIKLYKTLKKYIPAGHFKESIITRFGSADYKNAGPMRQIFVRVVNEDLSDIAQKVVCPTLLIYGTLDNETPPEFGQRYSQLIKTSKLFLLDGQDHYSVLSSGRHQVIKILNDFVKDIQKKDHD